MFNMKKILICLTSLNFDNIEIDKQKNIYKNFQIILFDTAGQERYKAITKSYFRDSQGIILLYLAYYSISIYNFKYLKNLI